MANLTKSKIPVAAPKNRNHDVSATHLTTQSFMNFDIVCAKELVPNSHLKDVHKCFMRALPLDLPTLGSFKVHNRAFFVPFRTVWRPFTDFITDVSHDVPGGTGIIPYVPRLTMKVILDLFVTYGSQTITQGRADFIVGSTSYRFTRLGRQWYKILRSLGYSFEPVTTGTDTFYFSALPILCAAKVYLDWYFPNAYAHTSLYASVSGLFKYEVTFDLDVVMLYNIMSMITYVSYNSDFFTTCWDKPTGPNSGAGSLSFNFPDVTLGIPGNGSHVEQRTNADAYQGTPFILPNTTSGQGYISQYNVDSLKALTDYVKRHQLAGSRNFERMLAEFGIVLDVSKLERSYYLGSDDFPIQIGDVISTADTSSSSGGAQLGSYAGKAIGYSEGHTFEADVDEFGYYMVISSIIPDVAYTDGYDYNLRHISLKDFYTPEFDMLAVRAVERGEIVGSIESVPANVVDLLDDLFGYAPYYSEYRVGRDVLSGDFVVPSVSGGLEAWLTTRMFDYTSGGNAWNLVHSLDFMLGSDADQYLRVFGAIGKDATDPFFVVHSDNMLLSAPMQHLYDTYDFDNEGHADSNITTDTGGAKFN